MVQQDSLICPGCGLHSSPQSRAKHCASCGAMLARGAATLVRRDAQAGLSRQSGFDLLWFGIALGVFVVLTGLIVVGLPRALPALDFEGSAGMVVALPVWFMGGLLVGFISPGRTFVEPVVAALVVAAPTAVTLFQGQTVRTMPAFMYLLFSALGLLFTLVGAYAGERLQFGATPRQGP